MAAKHLLMLPQQDVLGLGGGEVCGAHVLADSAFPSAALSSRVVSSNPAKRGFSLYFHEGLGQLCACHTAVILSRLMVSATPLSTEEGSFCALRLAMLAEARGGQFSGVKLTGTGQFMRSNTLERIVWGLTDTANGCASLFSPVIECYLPQQQRFDAARAALVDDVARRSLIGHKTSSLVVTPSLLAHSVGKEGAAYSREERRVASTLVRRIAATFQRPPFHLLLCRIALAEKKDLQHLLTGIGTLTQSQLMQAVLAVGSALQVAPGEERGIPPQFTECVWLLLAGGNLQQESAPASDVALGLAFRCEGELFAKWLPNAPLLVQLEATRNLAAMLISFLVHHQLIDKALAILKKHTEHLLQQRAQATANDRNGQYLFLLGQLPEVVVCQLMEKCPAESNECYSVSKLLLQQWRCCEGLFHYDLSIELFSKVVNVFLNAHDWEGVAALLDCLTNGQHSWSVAEAVAPSCRHQDLTVERAARVAANCLAIPCSLREQRLLRFVGAVSSIAHFATRLGEAGRGPLRTAVGLLSQLLEQSSNSCKQSESFVRSGWKLRKKQGNKTRESAFSLLVEEVPHSQIADIVNYLLLTGCLWEATSVLISAARGGLVDLRYYTVATLASAIQAAVCCRLPTEELKGLLAQHRRVFGTLADPETSCVTVAHSPGRLPTMAGESAVVKARSALPPAVDSLVSQSVAIPCGALWMHVPRCFEGFNAKLTVCTVTL